MIESKHRKYVLLLCVLFIFATILFNFIHRRSQNIVQIGHDLPNIVLVVTDDQDVVLHGMEPMPFTRNFFETGGITFKNAFVSTPVCCPSRATLLTGQHQHNTLVRNNTVSGGCASLRWRLGAERRTFATHLQRRGYNTFYAGKYLNQYGLDNAGGPEHVPPGWHWWAGLVGNSRYYNYTLSVNGTARWHGDDYRADYLTDRVAHLSLEFLRAQRPAGAPFLLVAAVPAPHTPHTPAPQNAALFPDARVPRTASFNRPVTDRHPLLLEQPAPLPAPLVSQLDAAFRDRWRTLVSVDNLLEALVSQLKRQGLLENTVVVFTSDHGYHLGQFSLTVDKRQPYEFDVRVPLYVRGLDLPAGRTLVTPVSAALDVAPTLLQLAGVAPHEHRMDGVSLLESVAAETRAEPPLSPAQGAAPARSGLLVSYNGEYDMAVDAACSYRGTNVSHCYQQMACKCQDSRDNTYRCIRELRPPLNRIVCRFTVGEEFWEVYDLANDPEQLTNLASNLSASERHRWRRRLAAAETCRGAACRRI